MTEPAFLGIEASVGGRRWQARTTDDRMGLALAQRLGVPEMVGRLLAGRGVGIEDAELFLNPSLRTSLPDPSQFLDMDRAAERLARAIMAGDAIAIFGDYDVDGATSTALLVRFLRSVGIRPGFYIPDRIQEGYGPNAPALLGLARQGYRLIITVDCGATAHAPLAEAMAAGIDIIVCDHHVGEAQLPPALAVINPNRLDEQAGHRQLAAVGVTFLLVVATNRHLRLAGWYGADRREPDLLQWLDLVALGTVCDVVPLTGVNRALVAQGLKIVRRRLSPGLAALADVAKLAEQPEAYHLGFLLGPRVNAGGRVGQSDLGVRLLISDDDAEAAMLAQELNRFNDERRQIEAIVLEQAVAQAESGDGAAPMVFVFGEQWHAGVIGIVASRLKDRFNRPTWVVAVEDGVAKASGRSVPGVPLGDIVIAARQAGLLINGGGHAMAAGFTADASKLPAIAAFMGERVGAAIVAGDLRPILRLDGALDCRAVTPDLFAQLRRLEPYGAGNSEPRFVIRSVRIARADVVGERHVRAFLSGGQGGRLKSIAFRAVDTPIGQALLTSQGRSLHVAGQLKPDLWSGPNAMQLFIDDVAEPVDPLP